MNSNRRNKTLFNASKVVFISSSIPVEIYTIFLLSSSDGGKIIFGLLMMGSLAILIGLQPAIGRMIDAVKRRTLIRWLQLSSLVIEVFIFIAWYLNAVPSIILLSGFLMYVDVSEAFYFNAMSALLQTISGTGSYVRSNGLSEISGQLPSMIGPAMAIPVLHFLGPRISLLLSASLASVSLLLISFLNEDYIPPRRVRGRNDKMAGTISVIMAFPKQVVLIYLLNFPFIMVMVGNLVKPVFIVSVLHGGVADLSLSEMGYAAFAAMTGLFMSIFPVKNEMASAFLFFSIYLAGIILMPFASEFAIYMILQSLHGIGNPGTRISRNSFVMRHVPRELHGRFSSSVSMFSNITRISILAVFTAEINLVSPVDLLLTMGIITAAALLMAAVLKRSVDMRPLSSGIPLPVK
ncbi:MFS transporter [Thermoplasma acidophilum]|uniref:MFS transporter n=1 Tax=Thermoplasma acidophilum TaxID=2303 RepID=UPI00064E4AC6|nr:MFS transporter [Thermoplasma acidophilum]MCY0852144.1 MFS transporter [Thermoplasma acidophilum]